jgi:hypothetical protein
MHPAAGPVFRCIFRARECKWFLRVYLTRLVGEAKQKELVQALLFF